MLISIVLIFLIALGAVSAADDVVADDAVAPATVDEVQTIDNTITNDDISYESTDIIVNDTGDSGDSIIAAEKTKTTSLSSNELSDGDTKSFSDLADKVSSGGFVQIKDNYVYNSGDSQYVNGIIISKDTTLMGNNGLYRIDGSNEARLFSIADGATLTLIGLTLTGGSATEGGAIYVGSGTLAISDSDFTENSADYGGAVYTTSTGEVLGEGTFTNNVATYRGGAIYSEGFVDLSDSVIDSNDITYRARNDDNGGAAVYNNGGTLNMDNVQVTNNLKDIHIRNGNDGHLINAVIFTNSRAYISNSYIANNSGSWGGGIYVTGDETLTVTDTFFYNNMATFGAAIYSEGTPIVVERCNFTKNHCEGIGSPGTSDGQAGAILIMDEGASAVITESIFTENSAKVGGAISVSQASGDVLITDCEFTENQAQSEGGAIYNYAADGATLTVEDSTFTDNVASFGSAISNDADLILSGNTITGASTTPIGNYYGTIESETFVKILNGETVTTTTPTNTITAVITDDSGNSIIDNNLVLIVGDDEVAMAYDKATSIHSATYTFTNPGTYEITAKDYDAAHTTSGTIKFDSALSGLQSLINENTNGTIDLTYGFGYLESYDSALKDTGIIVDKTIILNGNGVTIDGADISRLFKVTNGGFLTLNNITIANGAAEKGAGVYVENGGKLTAKYATFTENVAVKRGGAIYSEGTVNVEDSKIYKNNVTYRTENDDNGGGAIYNLGGNLTVTDTNITDNQNDVVPRDGNDGDLINAAIVTTGDATFTGCNISKNSGSWGGGIYATGAGTLTVKDSVFEENYATFGAAVYDEKTKVIIENCDFIKNHCGGLGSSGSSNTQAGAVLVMGAGSTATITDSRFKENSAKVGGAISFAGVQDSSISGCTFTDNVGTSEGGAIYSWTQQGATATVSGNTFSGNTAPFGSAISNDGTLSLSDNEIANDYSVTPIGNYYGTIESAVYVKILNGETVTTSTATNDITAVLTDDNDNPIVDRTLVLLVNNEEVETSYDKTTGLHTGSYTFAAPGTYEVTAKNFDAAHTTAGTIVYTEGTFTELQNLINAAEEGATITLDHDLVYNANFDGANLLEGIIVNKALTIVGAEGVEICGNDLARVFKVTDNAVLTLKDVTVCDGAAEKGAGVYVDAGASLVADNVTFTENVAVKRGGAIYSEGNVAVSNSVIDSNDITFRTQNDDNGGAAIYNNKGALIVEKTNITNNLKDIVIRNGNAGDLLVGVVVTSGETLITDSYFANNTGSWGGAISSLGYMNNEDYTLTVTGTTFEGNNATFGGAIFVESSNLVVDDCTFNENAGVGVGSSGTSNTQGGAIVVHPSGSKATITNSRFNKNSANTGGAVSLAGVGQDSLIEGCTFTDNTANDGGAVYLWTGGNAVVTVKDSSFSGNTANFGSAISSDGTLSLSHNEIANDYTITPIGSYDGTIVSETYVTTLNGKTIITGNPTQNLTATITDDNGNPVVEKGLVLIVRGEEVETIYDKTTGIHSAIYTFTEPRSYRITADEFDQDHTTPGYIVYTGGTFTELQDLINAAEEGATITLDHDIVYNEDFDSIPFLDGITVNKTVTIVGAEGVEICGNDLARVFKVTNNAVLTLKDVTVCDGAAENGAGVYVDAGATLNADNVAFNNNTATYRGGAIWSTGTVNVDNCVFDNNNITYRARNVDNGGAAIFNNGTLNVNHSNFTNDLVGYVVRTGDTNSPQLIDGVILSSGVTVINNSYFENNSGTYGGAITAVPIASLGSTTNSLTVENSEFVNNLAYCGAAISINADGTGTTTYSIKNCTFIGNNATGVGSTGSTSAGGAISIARDSEGTITDSKFYNNTATQGGAIDVSATRSSSKVTIDNCDFENNTAIAGDGGAVRISKDNLEVAVKNSNFTNNDATGAGAAIYNNGVLELSGNTIGTTSADIYNWAGSIESEVKSTILANTTYNWHIADFVINATLTDDMGNLINDHNFNYVITKEGETDSILVPATFYTSLAYYQGTFTPADIGTYLISLDYAVEEVNTSVVVVSRSLIDLANIIAADEDGIIDLDDSYTYIEEFDSSIVDGIVIGKDVTINGNGHTICGDDKARLFHVTDKALTLNNVTLCHGTALNGGAVYVESGATLNANNAEFNENTATYRGGAIWSTGTVNVDNSVFDNNNITYRAANADNGGAAIFNNGTLNVDHSNFTNDLVGYVVRTGDTNSPQLIDGIILSSGVAVINNSHFENNSGTYGGAITAVPIASLGSTATSLTVENCEFINNLAYCGAGISINADGNGKTTYSIKNSTFIGNNATGVGSTGYTSAGGAISIARDSEGTITDSKFYNNTATVGGAIDVSATRSSSKVTIDNCDFENNTATAGDGGAVRISKNNLEVAVKNSNFTNNDATGDGAAIYNNGVLTLEGNKVTSGETEIYVGPNGAVVNSIVKAIFLGDAEDNTILAFLGDEVHPYATLTDDNGNAIYDVDFNITVDGAEYETSYDDSTQQYTATYTILHAGDNIVSTNYDAQKTDGKYDVPKANATIVVTTENISVGDKATVNINLTGTDGVGLNGTVKITINKAFTDTVETENGINVTEVEGLEIGEYFVYVYFEGNYDYNPEYNYTLFRVTGDVSYFNVTIEDITYDAAATIKVTVQDGPIDDPDNGVTGIVLVTIQGKDVNFENTYSVSVIAGEGSYTVEGLAPGNYSYAAKLLADELYNEAYLEPQNFTVFENPYSELEVTDDGPIASGETVNITATLTDFKGNPIP